MQYNTPKVRPETSTQAATTAVRQMIVDGRLAAAQRVNEVRLAQALGVSRTPLREALNRLATEGALSSTPAIGYTVRPLTALEFEQLYEIRPILDPQALRRAGLPSPRRLARLEALNQRFATAKDGETAIALDDEWHLALIETCPNRVLVELIQNIMLRTRRYELALLRARKNLARSTEDHDAILAALRAGDLATACAALERNMQNGREPMLAWLAAREAGAAQ
jgi:DNA-binding GntR family transcriptional regulator